MRASSALTHQRETGCGVAAKCDGSVNNLQWMVHVSVLEQRVPSLLGFMQSEASELGLVTSLDHMSSEHVSE